REPGQAVNALDSMGEAMFLNGKFKESEKSLLEAYQKDPAFLGGAPLWKAAHARWLDGDLQGADALVDRFNQAPAQDPLRAWRQATWLYETGRQQQAITLLKSEPQTEPVKKQLAVWADPKSAVPREPGELKQLYEKSEPVSDGLARTLYASALF